MRRHDTKPRGFQQAAAAGCVGVERGSTGAVGGPTLRVLPANEPIVIGVRADPEPQVAAICFDRECTVTKSNPHGPVTSDLLELQGWVPRVVLEKLEIAISQSLHRARQGLIGGPELRRREMLHSSRE